jgi:outer membrane protein OmpA-like peptidoglycan-associated protein
MRAILAIAATFILCAAPASAQDALSVGFARQDASLTPTARAELDAFAAQIAAGDGALILAGHADASEPDAVLLSNRRAGAVRDHLVSRGVSASRITTLAYGSERPTIGATDPAQSRRVELTVGPSSGW